MRSRLVRAIVVLIVATVAEGFLVAPALAEPVAQCRALTMTDFSVIADAPSEVFDARVVSADGAVPAHCRATGYVATHVGFTLDLPLTGWNGKFVEAGCGGFCGRQMDWYCVGPLSQGYACIVSDLGHVSSASDPSAGGFSALWAFSDLQAQVDQAYRGAHVVAVAGKAIVDRFYERRPSKAYFVGCSDGGREGLSEAQRFPYDFDGIIAGAPAANYAATMLSQVWNERNLFDSAGKPLFDTASTTLVQQAVLAACDMDDGVKDGVVGNPAACRFDPAKLQCKDGQTGKCLSQAQVAALANIYSGPHSGSGLRLAPGGTTVSTPLAQFYVPGSFGRTRGASFAEEFLRYFGLSPAPGPGWKLRDFDVGTDYARIGGATALMSATNPDLRAFAAAGGKLILYHGWDDPLISPWNTIDYFQTMQRTMGGPAATEGFAKLYMIPGMHHCALGPGAWKVDFLGALDGWAARGVAPGALIAQQVQLPPDVTRIFRLIGGLAADPASVTFSRPLYPYPARAIYKSGNQNDPGSFREVR